MKLRSAVILSILAAALVVALAGFSAQAATANTATAQAPAAASHVSKTTHGCHYYCGWVWLGYGSGAWCGADHAGDIVHDLATGEGYRCNWLIIGGVHDGYWTGGYG